jgi:hypothetical protein
MTFDHLWIILDASMVLMRDLIEQISITLLIALELTLGIVAAVTLTFTLGQPVFVDSTLRWFYESSPLWRSNGSTSSLISLLEIERPLSSNLWYPPVALLIVVPVLKLSLTAVVLLGIVAPLLGARLSAFVR